MKRNDLDDQWQFPFCPAQPDWKLDWDSICQKFDWVKNMAGTRQDTVYHAEGDVLIHTKMVCETLAGLFEWRQLNGKERAILFAAALLHDVAKPVCTKIENGEITSKGHAVKGEIVARKILYKSVKPISFETRETIVKLVRYHGLPLFFLEKEYPEQTIIEASQTVPMRWLAMLAKADAVGRMCPDKNELLERIQLFEEFCKEQHCFYEARSFHSNYSRFIYFQKQNGYADYEAYDDLKFEVTLMSGLPASGKSTWITRNCKGLPVISLDDIRDEYGISPRDDQGAVIQAARDRAKGFLREQASFVWDATNLTKSLRRQLINLFSSYGAKVKIVYLDTPYEELLKRNKARTRSVPERVIDRMIEKLEVPTVTEAHEVIYTPTLC